MMGFGIYSSRVGVNDRVDENNSKCEWDNLACEVKNKDT